MTIINARIHLMALQEDNDGDVMVSAEAFGVKN